MTSPSTAPPSKRDPPLASSALHEGQHLGAVALLPQAWRDTAWAMSEENVENVRAGYERFAATGDFAPVVTADFVWDVSNLHWPEQQVYEGADGARTFLREWEGVWDDWELEVDALHDAGDRVVVLVRQRGRSKTAGMPVEMSFAQVWTLRDGKAARMEMYSDPAEALEAAGLSE